MKKNQNVLDKHFQILSKIDYFKSQYKLKRKVSVLVNKISKETQIMIDNLKREKEKFFDSTNVKNKELTNEKVKEEFKQLFS